VLVRRYSVDGDIARSSSYTLRRSRHNTPTKLPSQWDELLENWVKQLCEQYSCIAELFFLPSSSRPVLLMVTLHRGYAIHMCVVIEALQVHLPTCWPRLCFIVDFPTTTTTTTTFVNDCASFTYQSLPGWSMLPHRYRSIKEAYHGICQKS
ncbi:hypothetical protein V1477_015291, partial [Vespula maculifrons]